MALLNALAAAWGQTLSVAANAAPNGSRLEVAFEGFEVEGTTATLALRLGEQLGLGLDLRRSESFGPLGNLVFELGADADTADRAQGRFSVRGVVGPVAGRAAAVVFNAAEAAFAPAALASDGRPVTAPGQFGGGLELGADIRVGSTVISLQPDIYLIDRRFGARIGGELRLLRALGATDLRLLLHGYAQPGFEAGHGAVGVGITWRRRRAPAWSTSVWLGQGERLLPGFRGRIAERLDGGGRVALEVAVEPYRRDLQPFRLTAELVQPLASGEITVLTAAVWQDRLQALARVGWRLPYPGPDASGSE